MCLGRDMVENIFQQPGDRNAIDAQHLVLYGHFALVAPGVNDKQLAVEPTDFQREPPCCGQYFPLMVKAARRVGATDAGHYFIAMPGKFSVGRWAGDQGFFLFDQFPEVLPADELERIGMDFGQFLAQLVEVVFIALCRKDPVKQFCGVGG